MLPFRPMGIAGDVPGVGRRMSILKAFIASIALVFGIAWVGEASAQSSLPPRQSNVWNRCVGTYKFSTGEKYVGEYRDGKFNGHGVSSCKPSLEYD